MLKRLKEKHDPQLSSIMRTLDDSVIFNFIDCYKGCTMSVDAILQHIGANVSQNADATNSDQIDMAAPALVTKRVIDQQFRLVPRESKSKGAGFRQTPHGRTNRDRDNHQDKGGRVATGGAGGYQHHMSADNLLPLQQPDKVRRSS